MDKSDGQIATAASRPKGRATRQRLLAAAAELIAEVGWARVTTRAVAARAGLPHGTVSYHFRGKEELLTEAAIDVFERAFPLAELEALQELPDVVALVEAWFGERGASDPLLWRVEMESMLEYERNEVLRKRLAVLLDRYRQVVLAVVRSGQERGTIDRGISAPGLAMLLTALFDGLFLHERIDPELDVADALNALKALLSG